MIGLKELNEITVRQFDRWMDTLELERECWAASDKFDELRKGAAREGAGKAKELHEEILPLVFFGKISLGCLKRADCSLEFKANLENKKHDGNLEFDAEYRWKSFQKIASGYDTQGYIEITSCLIDGHQSLLGQKYLTEHHSAMGNSRYKTENRKAVVAEEGGAGDIDQGVAETSAIITKQFRTKLGKKYPENTTLILWLSDAQNPRYSIYADWKHLKEEILALNNGKFKAVCVLSWQTQQWIIGSSLP